MRAHHPVDNSLNWLRKWTVTCVSLVGLGLLAPPVNAIDYTSYAQLLQTHVRPGRINGIRLNVVDYRGIMADPTYPKALQEFSVAEPKTFQTDAERFAFWVNAYNLLAIKAVVDQYPTKSIRDGGSLFRSIWKKKVGTVAAKEYALDDIEHGILRKEFQQPRVHFAIVCASLSCPDLRTEPYVAERLNSQLDDATRAFLENPTKGLTLGAQGKRISVSRIFKWFPEDFEPVGGVANFIRGSVDPGLANRVRELSDSNLSYLNYDWSLNDAARAP